MVEDTLLKDETSKPPGKNLLTGTPQKIKCIVVDVTESPIERPKKTKKRIIQGKRSGIPDPGNHQPKESADSGHTAGEGQRPRFQVV